MNSKNSNTPHITASVSKTGSTFDNGAEGSSQSPRIVLPTARSHIKASGGLQASGAGYTAPPAEPWSESPTGSVHTSEHEEKNIFSSLNPETLSKIEEVLCSTNEGQEILKGGLSQVAEVDHKDIMNESVMSLKIDESAESTAQEELELVLDESLIAESLNPGNLSAIATAFGADHAYASTPQHKSDTEETEDNKTTDVSRARKTSESELNTSRDETQDSQEDLSAGSRSRRGRSKRRGITPGSRRSTRVQEISQRQEAEKIMAENLEKERAALESIQKLKPGEKIPVVKSYNMRTGRPRRDDGRIDYTKLASGQGRVKVGGAGDDDAESTEDLEERHDDEDDSQEVIAIGDSTRDDEDGSNDGGSSQEGSVRVVKRSKKRTLHGLQADSDNEQHDSQDSTDLEFKGRGRTRGSVRSRGRVRGRGGREPTSGRFDEETSESESVRGGTSRRGRARGSRRRANGRAPAKARSDPALSPSDSEEGSVARQKSRGESDEERMAAEDDSRDEDEIPLAKMAGKGRVDEMSESEDEEGSSDDIPLSELKGSKTDVSKQKKKGSKYEQDDDYKVTQSSEEDMELLGDAGEAETVKTQPKTLRPRDPYEMSSSTNEEEYDDPKKKWCICHKPWHNRFMICCDRCSDWFHGSCVGVSMRASKKTKEWICPRCIKEATSGNAEVAKGNSTTELSKLEELKLEKGEESEEDGAVVKNVEETSENEASPSKASVKVDDKEKTKHEKIEKDASDFDDEGDVIKSVAKDDEEPGGDLPEDVQETIDEIFGQSDDEEEDTGDTDYVDEARAKKSNAGDNKGGHNTSAIMKKAEKNKEAVNVLIQKLDTVRAKRERKEQKEEIVKTERRKEAERVDKAKKEVERREKERAVAKDSEFVASRDRCIATGCKRRKRKYSVYCSDRCIDVHATQSLQMIKEQRDKIGFKSQGGVSDSSSERIVVMERQSGHLLNGPAAPTEATLKSWLIKHPSYEVLQPGQNSGAATATKKKKVPTATLR